LRGALALAFTAGPATAASLTNGDFGDGLNGWSLDTDGLGAPDLTLYADFGVEAVGSGNVARIEVDYYDASGVALDYAWFANTL